VRRAVVDRRTRETQIRVRLGIEGKGRYDVSTGIRFLDHMLELMTRHGGFDLEVRATGDLDVDQHHTVEDLGIALGEAVSKAIGTRRGINRAGYFVMPMDEALGVAGHRSWGPSACRGRSRPEGRPGRRSAERARARFLRGICAGGARQTCTSRCSTAAPAIITWKRCSKRSAARCAWRAPRDKQLLRTLPSTKGLL
jgi:imidazoleglycerol-phosphate dehydratase